MGKIGELAQRAATWAIRASLRDPDPALKAFFGVVDNASGVAVNEHLALNLSGVFSATRILSETLASLPLKVYRFTDIEGDRELDRFNPFTKILGLEPNPDMTAFSMFETTMAHVAIWGNAFIEIERNRAGGVKALWPLLPDRTKAERINGRMHFTTQVKGQTVELNPRNTLHVPGMGWDGIRGYSIVAQARESIALGLATEKFGGKFFGNGARPMGVLQMERSITNPAQRQEMRENWEQIHQGTGNANRVAVLEGGMKWQEIGTPPNDAQFLETRLFQLREIARWFRLPPHLLGDLADATFSNVEHMGLEFVIYTMRPWLVRWEQALKRKLFASENGQVFPEFLVEGLLRGDIDTRYQAYSRGRQNGFLSSNDIRRMENMNNIGPQGDVYTVQLNLVNLEALQAVPEPDDPDPAQARAQRAMLDMASERSATSRRRLENRHRNLIKVQATRAVTREVGAARRALASMVAEGGQRADFETWISRFYPAHRDFLISNFLPVFSVLGEAMYSEAAREVGGVEDVDGDAQVFFQRFVEGMSTRLVSSAEGQLRELLSESSDEEIGGAIATRLDEWDDTKADKTVQRNLRQAGAAFAILAWQRNGISRKVWRTVGKNCPLCNTLSGNTVSIDSAFVTSGDEVDPNDGKTTPLRATQNFKHPPLHGGCDCMVVPG